ncbi:hypothetical protein J6S39_01795 [Candidatus Saccharibacteria bacterium]|nr:hypothetical protein [Candidatus Saccharibacteria bacterium]
MNIYISGISGTGLGPLALMAKKAGMEVSGSDKSEGAVTGELVRANIDMEIGKQDGSFLKKQFDKGKVDWFVYTSALPENHPELVLARELGVRISKRDELISYLVDKMGLKMVAVAGTHGKTTTTAMITYGCLALGMPISYLVGTTLPFAESGRYDSDSDFLIYEADEYDRNFLHFYPWLSVITTVSYDHPDIYKTKLEYLQAFAKFEGQSENVIRGRELEGAAVDAGAAETIDLSGKFSLAGKARRYDASLAMQAIFEMVEELDMMEAKPSLIDGVDYAGQEINEAMVVEILNSFPGVGRRFERIIDGVYSDYGHHPEEIAATIEMAREEADRLGLPGVVAIYEPHQNVRQHEIFDGYKDAFSGVSKLFWLPTYLVREDPALRVITPADFIASLSNSEVGEPAEVGPELATKLRELRDSGNLILLMTAGPADKWLREEVFKSGNKG